MTIASPETLEYLRNRTPEQAAADSLRFEQSWANMTQGTKLGEKLEGQYGGGWDFDPLGKPWMDAIVFGSTGAAGGNTLAQDIASGNPVGVGSSPEALNFLQKVGSKLGNMLPNVMPDNINPATGNDPNYDALPPGAKERFNNMIEGKESPIQVGW